MDGDVDTDHAHLYAAGEFARNFTIAGEYRLTPETVSTRLWVMLLVCKLNHFAHQIALYHGVQETHLPTLVLYPHPELG